MSLSGILGLEEQHLRDRQVGDPVVNRRADEDDAVLEQPRKDVVGALAAVGLLDHHRDELLYAGSRTDHAYSRVADLVGGRWTCGGMCSR